MEDYTFEVKFCGPFFENILDLRDKLSKEEMEAIADNFFDKVYIEDMTTLASISGEDYFSDYTVEANTEEEALSILDEKTKPFEKEEIYVARIERVIFDI